MNLHDDIVAVVIGVAAAGVVFSVVLAILAFVTYRRGRR